tara:strand:- start:10396 stop:10980 length:585 start_codon:yes stop_codon:yes gene_type:complete
MGAVAAIGAVIGVASAGVKMYDQNKQENAAEQQIRIDEQRARMQADQTQVQRAKKEQWVLGEQKAMAAARGESQASGSFGAVALGSASAYVTDSNIAKTNLNWQLSDMNSKIDQYRSTLHSEMFGDFLSAAGSAVNLVGGKPGASGASGASSGLSSVGSAAQSKAWDTQMDKVMNNPLGSEFDNYLGNTQYGEM